MKFKGSIALIVSSVALALSGCSDSDSEESSYTSAYVQFYNGSPNAPSVTMTIDDTDVGTSEFGDATSLSTQTDDELEFEWTYVDEDDNEQTILEDDYSLTLGQKTLFLLTGDFNSPEFSQITYDRKDLDDEFRLFFASVVTDGSQYDVYVGEDGASLADSYKLATLSSGEYEELTYWETSDDYDYWDSDEYVVYLTEPGETEPLFSSDTISFAYDTEYVLIIRKSVGALKDQLEVDMVLNSTSVSTLTDLYSTSQYRMYNSIDDDLTLTATLSDYGTYTESTELASNELSEFTQIAYGDYALDAALADTDLAISQHLVSMNRSESKLLVFYQDSDGELDVLSVTESDLPQTYEHDIRLANLVDDFYDVDIYFVLPEETIDDATHYFKGLNFAESGKYQLPIGYYEIVVVYDDGDDKLLLLDRTDSMKFEQDETYLITIEDDQNSPTGYSVVVNH